MIFVNYLKNIFPDDANLYFSIGICWEKLKEYNYVLDSYKKAVELRKDERFLRCSYSEIVRQVMEHGIDLLQTESASPGQSGAGMQDSA